MKRVRYMLYDRENNKIIYRISGSRKSLKAKVDKEIEDVIESFEMYFNYCIKYNIESYVGYSFGCIKKIKELEELEIIRFETNIPD